MLAFVALLAIPLPALQGTLIANATPETRKLGKARAAFFDALFKVGQKRREMDYVGYRSMLMVDHTTMLWPVGRADEVVFDYGSSGRSLLTHWKLENATPKRLFQISYVDGKRAFPYGGTLCAYLGKLKATVPKRYAKPLKSLLTMKRDYATYIGSAAEGVYYCRVVRQDGSYWPVKRWDPEKIPYQSDDKVKLDGFAITEEEQRLLGMRKPG